jgi:uncharacterized protein
VGAKAARRAALDAAGFVAMTLDARFDRLERRPLPHGLAILVAGNRRSRMLGLARLEHLPADHAMLFERCRSIHTAGMRFALDLLWLDRQGGLVRLDRAVQPRRIRTCLRATAVVEANAGQGERFAAALAALDEGTGPGTTEGPPRAGGPSSRQRT